MDGRAIKLANKNLEILSNKIAIDAIIKYRKGFYKSCVFNLTYYE